VFLGRLLGTFGGGAYGARYTAHSDLNAWCFDHRQLSAATHMPFAYADPAHLTKLF
jgi:hypothetical protein